jgi:hypothetical protein
MMESLTAQDLKFYEASRASGGFDLAINPLNKVHAGLFGDIVSVDLRQRFISYRKVFLFNSSPDFTLLEPKIQIITNTNNFFSIARTISGNPLPVDADDINVDTGDGPGIFTTGTIAFPNPIVPNDYVSFWIRFASFWDRKESVPVNLELKATGQSEGI